MRVCLYEMMNNEGHTSTLLIKRNDRRERRIAVCTLKGLLMINIRPSHMMLCAFTSDGEP
jgi:hypothetical protein